MSFGGREGPGDRYFRGGRKISLGAARNWRAISVVQVGAMDCRRRSFLRKPDKTVRQDIYIASHTTLSSKLLVVYLIFSLCFERQNGVTEGKDGV